MIFLGKCAPVVSCLQEPINFTIFIPRKLWTKGVIASNLYIFYDCGDSAFAKFLNKTSQNIMKDTQQIENCLYVK